MLNFVSLQSDSRATVAVSDRMRSPFTMITTTTIITAILRRGYG